MPSAASSRALEAFCGAVRMAGAGCLAEDDLDTWVSTALLDRLGRATVAEYFGGLAQRMTATPAEVVDLDASNICARFEGADGTGGTWCCLRTEPASSVVDWMDFTPTTAGGVAPSELRTSRLVLRRIHTDRDRAALVAHFADPDVMRLFGTGQTYDTDTTEALLISDARHWVTRGYGLWAIRDGMTDVLLGQIGLLYLRDRRDVEIEFTLDPGWWGRGLTTEAASAVLAVAATDLGLPRVVAMTHPDNAGSLRVLSKVGMHYEHDEPRFGQPRRWYATAR